MHKPTHLYPGIHLRRRGQLDKNLSVSVLWIFTHPFRSEPTRPCMLWKAGREERLLGRLCTSRGSATTLRYTNQSICRHILQAVISHGSAVAMSMRGFCAPVKFTGSSDMPSFARFLGKSIGFGNAAARRWSLLHALRPRHHAQRAHLPAHTPRKAATSRI